MDWIFAARKPFALPAVTGPRSCMVCLDFAYVPIRLQEMRG